ncbi:hypothetical protein BTVI_50378 [Pitangus sulphuratus]|nr:hypothetical protein BTVI_50378 [Pitangus sulphuratus]
MLLSSTVKIDPRNHDSNELQGQLQIDLWVVGARGKRPCTAHSLHDKGPPGPVAQADWKKAMDTVYHYFTRAFDTFSRKVFTEKLLKNGLNEQTARWIENCQNGPLTTPPDPEWGDQQHKV